MSVNTFVENMRNIHLPQVPLPYALYFKERGGLATNSLSCHPQRMREKKRKEKKMREK